MVLTIQLTLHIQVFITGGTQLVCEQIVIILCFIFLLILSTLLFAGWLHLQPKFKPSLSWFKNNESRLNHIYLVYLVLVH